MLLTYLAQAVDLTILGKGLMLGIGLIGPALGIGLVGSSYFHAVGRNPETTKTFGQALVFGAIIELFGLLAFASLFIVK